MHSLSACTFETSTIISLYWSEFYGHSQRTVPLCFIKVLMLDMRWLWKGLNAVTSFQGGFILGITRDFLFSTGIDCVWYTYDSDTPNPSGWLCLVRTAVLPASLFFLSFFFTTVLSQWDFSHGKFRLPSRGKISCDRVVLPNLRCMLGVLVFPQSTELWYELRDL